MGRIPAILQDMVGLHDRKLADKEGNEMEFIFEADRIYVEMKKGKVAAEILFPQVAPGVAAITHTYVEESLRGQGVAGDLMAAAVEQIRLMKLKIRPECSFAKAWFERHPDKAGLLEETAE